MTADKYLAEAERLAEGATKGPWKIWGMTVMADPKGTSNVDDGLPIAHTTDPHRGMRTFNAQFIAAARTGWPQTVAALRAVLEVHDKVPVYTTEAGECDHGEDCEGVEVGQWSMIVCPDTTDGYTCGECSEIGRDNPDGEWPEWPCPTVRSINDHLEAKP